MESSLPTISLLSLFIAFIPGLILIAILYRWSLKASSALYANARMLVQLLIVGYVLTYIFETEQPAIIVGVIVVIVYARP